MTNKQWRRIEGTLPGKASDRGVTAKDNRLFVEAVLWMARNGASWRALPEAYGNWHSVYVRFARWARRGIWHRVLGILSANADFDYVVVDSTIARAHQKAAGGNGVRGLTSLALPRRRPGLQTFSSDGAEEDSTAALRGSPSEGGS